MSNVENNADHDIYKRYSDERTWIEVVGHHRRPLKPEGLNNQRGNCLKMMCMLLFGCPYNFRRKPINFLERPWILRHPPKDSRDYPGFNLNILYLIYLGKNKPVHQPKLRPVLVLVSL